MRKVIIAGNWKMYKTRADALEMLQNFLNHLEQVPEDREIVICAPFTALETLSKGLHGTRVRIGAQNVHWDAEGAYTGEISGPMLTDLSVRYVIVGHSERRQYFGESDATVNLRLRAAQRFGLIPILCVGESKQQRDAGETEDLICGQLKEALEDVDQNNLVIAYEPIWAIGTGETCEATEANRIIKLIRSQLTNPDVSILYGGSVKPNNIDEIIAQPEIDGALVGGASLAPADFLRIADFQS